MTSNRSADSHEIRPLTGIRGFAASMVVLLHFFASWTVLFPPLKFLAPFASRGQKGVDLFFLLSGFILSYVYSAGDAKFGFGEYRRFLWFRLARVYPNHLAMLLCLVALVIGAHLVGLHISGEYPLSGLPFQLTMTHAWPFVHTIGWNYPSWTISAEWFAYLFMFPIAWWILRLKMPEWVCLILTFALLAFWVSISGSWENGVHPILQVSFEFIAGALLFNAYRTTGRFTRACQENGSILFGATLAIFSFWPMTSPWATPLLILLFPAVLLALTSETSLLSVVFSSAFALWLGRVSYALYMSHATSQKILKMLLPSERYVTSALPIRLCLLAANAGFILLVAAGLYYVVEIPSRNSMRRIYQKWSNRPEN